MVNPRLNRLLSAWKLHPSSALALNPGPSLKYLTGLNFHLSERPTLLVITPGGRAGLFLPELEMAKVSFSRIPLEAYPFGENPADWPQVLSQMFTALQIDASALSVEPTCMRFLELDLLQRAIPGVNFTSSTDFLASLRMFKDDEEIACMRKAVEIAQHALLSTLPHVKPGVTEKELASELVLQLLRHGSDSELAFSPIVAGGPNSANPHAVPSERKLAEGDLLLFDWGARYNGYSSDLTRTFAIGRVDEEFETIARAVLAANRAGVTAGRAGVPACQVDRAAREAICAAGYGDYFTHRTGHGLGMETHEPPYIFAENELLLQPGMTYTVEPGIYLPERGGVRIEDNVVVRADGAESLSDLPRDLIHL